MSLPRRAGLVCAGILLVGTSFLAVDPAFAQRRGQPVVSPEEAARTAAREHYNRGRELFAANQFAQALAEFRAAYQAVPNPVVLVSVAECEVRLGQIAEAASTLERYLATRPDAPDRAEIEGRLRQLRNRPGIAHVESTPPGALISVDGMVRTQTTPADVEVPGGEHTVTVTLAGHEPASQSIVMPPGGRFEVRLTLTPSAAGSGEEGVEGDPSTMPAPPPEEPEDESSGPGAGVWIAGGLAGVGLVAGTVFGFLALSDQSDFDEAPSDEVADRGERMALLSDISFGVAIAAGVTAVILYATDSRGGEEEAQPAARGRGRHRARATRSRDARRIHVTPLAGRRAAGVGASVSF